MILWVQKISNLYFIVMIWKSSNSYILYVYVRMYTIQSNVVPQLDRWQIYRSSSSLPLFIFFLLYCYKTSPPSHYVVYFGIRQRRKQMFAENVKSCKAKYIVLFYHHSTTNKYCFLLSYCNKKLTFKIGSDWSIYVGFVQILCSRLEAISECDCYLLGQIYGLYSPVEFYKIQ